MFVFSEWNCYRIAKDKKGKLDSYNIEVIAELGWDCMNIDEELRHCYLIKRAEKTEDQGFSYYDLRTMHDKNATFGRKHYFDTIMDEKSAAVEVNGLKARDQTINLQYT